MSAPHPYERRSPWTFEEAQDLVRALQAFLRPVGWCVGMAGSVLYSGRSEKDLDLILFPRNTEYSDMTTLRTLWTGSD